MTSQKNKFSVKDMGERNSFWAREYSARDPPR
ncbi:hypothetical protein PF007_g18805 [Phytophthora fragariae]|uniref:Uncharacterized protein n=1 Tax=Phytophthora fragariae TaxID=53985 RepID=A0A6A4CFA9_9STRA|nr:hypothetical protein PF003_g31050 [Phytophthora fragariae]KAE9091640.1 hypothetical protein PF007_g18805 [Phytophthora fragariae]KAE9290074.1 hypothetical protein PF001_g19761 [Phytophthora fragariae]KAE9305858.1 hypothetical protein PF008_g21614 [Phytophthora fragariae]